MDDLEITLRRGAFSKVIEEELPIELGEVGHALVATPYCKHGCPNNLMDRESRHAHVALFDIYDARRKNWPEHWWACVALHTLCGKATVYAHYNDIPDDNP